MFMYGNSCTPRTRRPHPMRRHDTAAEARGTLGNANQFRHRGRHRGEPLRRPSWLRDRGWLLGGHHVHSPSCTWIVVSEYARGHTRALKAGARGGSLSGRWVKVYTALVGPRNALHVILLSEPPQPRRPLAEPSTARTHAPSTMQQRRREGQQGLSEARRGSSGP